MEHLSQFIMNHLSLFLALIVILTLILINEAITQKKKAKELSPEAAIDKINNDNALIFDLRDKESFKKGHIIDSINATPEDFPQEKMKKYKNRTIILVCARGTQSTAAAPKLRTGGYQVLVLNGGLTAWQNANLPLIKDKN